MIRRFFAIPLWIRTFAGFGLGILAGLILRDKAEVWLQPIGDVYLNLIRMVVAPLVLFTIASSIAKLGEGAGAVRLGVPQAFAAFAVPLGASVKMDGCGAIDPAIASIFIAQYFNIDLSLTQYILIGLTAVLGSLGTAGVPGTSIVMLTLTLSTAGLPLEGIGYIVAIDRIIDMMRTATNVTGQMLVPVLVAKEEKILNEDIYNGHVAWLPGDPEAETPDTVKATGI